MELCDFPSFRIMKLSLPPVLVLSCHSSSNSADSHSHPASQTSSTILLSILTSYVSITTQY